MKYLVSTILFVILLSTPAFTCKSIAALPPAYGGGGTAIGALPYAIRSTDSLPAVFTSTGARDTYYTNNPNDLIGDLAQRRAAVGIGPTDGNPVGVTAAFIRNATNTGWEAIATNFIGQKGDKGDPGPPGDSGIDFGTLSPDSIIKTNTANTAFETSSLSEAGTSIDSTKQILVPDSQGIMFGAIQVIDGGFNIAAQTLDNRTFFPLTSELTTPGSQQPNWIKLAAQTTTASPANTTETFTGPNVQFRIINANTGLAEQYTFNAAAVSTNNNLIIRFTSHTGPEVFNFKRANGGTGFDLAVGENAIDLPGIGLFFRAGVELFATLEPGSGNISLRGQTIDVGGTDETFPFAQVLGRLAEDVNILTQDAGEFTAVSSKTTPHNNDVLLIEDSEDGSRKKSLLISNLPVTGGTPRTDEEIEDVVGAMVSGNVETGITVTYDDANGKLNFVVGSAPTGQSNFYYGLSSSNNPATVDLGTLTTQVINTGSGQQFNFAIGPATLNDYVILLTPAVHDIQTLINTLSGFSVLEAYTKTDNVRTINSINYDSYTLGPVVQGFSASYRATLQ